MPRVPAAVPGWRRACAGAGAALVALTLAAGWAGGATWVVTGQLCAALFGVTPLAVLARPPRSVEPCGQPTPPRWWQGAVPLACYVAVLVAWRLPGPVDALTRNHALATVELASAVAGSWWLWTELLGGRHRSGRSAPFGRLTLAAVSAWSTWIVAYVLGFSGGRGPTGGQEVSVIILFVAGASAFVPLVFWNLARWLAAEADRPDPVAAAYRAAPR